MDIETLKLAVLLFFIPGMFVWLPILAYFSFKSEEKKDKIRGDANEVKNQAKIDEEMKKPMYRIKFYTAGGSPEYTRDFPPRFDNIRSSRWFWLNTSKMEADEMLKHYYKVGYFCNNENLTFPTCNIMNAKVEVSGGT